jgi:hypothetical protein
MMEILMERERRLGVPQIDLKFSEKGSPVEGASSYNIRNYNVNSRSVDKQVSMYRPTVAYIDRKEQYNTPPSEDLQVEPIKQKYNPPKGPITTKTEEVEPEV